MNIRRFSVVFIFCVIVVLAASEAFPNGMSPPRPAAAAKRIISAKFKDKYSDLQHEIFRVWVKSGDHSSRTFTFQIDNVIQEISIATIETLSLSADEVDRDGFIKATFVLASSNKEKSAKVQVKTTNGNVKLTGFTDNGKEYNVELSDCKIVKFSCTEWGDATGGPQMLKH